MPRRTASDEDYLTRNYPAEGDTTSSGGYGSPTNVWSDRAQRGNVFGVGSYDRPAATDINAARAPFQPLPVRDQYDDSLLRQGKDTDIGDSSSADPVNIVAGGESFKFEPSVNGGGNAVAIKKGQPFAGRMQGGGKRTHIYGTWEYGSGYLGEEGRGVEGRPFPFYVWPVIWVGASTGSYDEYLYSTEYGLPDNTTRPGGRLTTLTYVSASSNDSTFRILTDNITATYLIASLATCNNLSSASSPIPQNYAALIPIGTPLPVQAIQYYRASSVVLTIDGYNNTAALSPMGSVSNVLLPGTTDIALLNCLNHTIGSTVILINKSDDWTAGDYFDVIVYVISGLMISYYLFFPLGMLIVCWIFRGVSRCLHRTRQKLRRRPRVEAPPLIVVPAPVPLPQAVLATYKYDVTPPDSEVSSQLSGLSGATLVAGGSRHWWQWSRRGNGQRAQADIPMAQVQN
ncbi:hypothetical protein H0H81_008725 [Sphagnurus paluster]|uniref:Uncharacterized protein n=1 Tax=Sphagnurus paluster TaxID=117069 RepID=A0A9P7GQZ2_9AGAR|nr:hypothetical protein H0H81_008725 [Sphagnurus paluster]